MTTESRQLVISLPKDGGIDMKNALKEIASSEHRTVSNKAFMILNQWLADNGPDQTEETQHERVTYDEENPRY